MFSWIVYDVDASVFVPLVLSVKSIIKAENGEEQLLKFLELGEHLFLLLLCLKKHLKASCRAE